MMSFGSLPNCRLQGKTIRVPTSSPPYDNMTEESAFDNPVYESGVSTDVTTSIRDVDSQNTSVLSWSTLSWCTQPPTRHSVLSSHCSPAEGSLRLHRSHSLPILSLKIINTMFTTCVIAYCVLVSEASQSSRTSYYFNSDVRLLDWLGLQDTNLTSSITLCYFAHWTCQLNMWFSTQLV